MNGAGRLNVAVRDGVASDVAVSDLTGLDVVVRDVAGLDVSVRDAAALEVAVLGVGVLGPGLANWASAQALLRSGGWCSTPTVVPPPARLPATERRRAGVVVKASVVVADEACAAAGLDPAGLATVFTSSTGDPLNCHLLCEALATAERMVSPTRFTNSVHNAAAGYWHIAAASRQPSTSLAAFDASFGAGLLEAACQCLASGQPVLLVACDAPYPEPLHALRPLPDVFAVALVLAPAGVGPRASTCTDARTDARTDTLSDTRTDPCIDTPADKTSSTNISASGARLSLQCSAAATPTACADAGLEALRRSIPAAQALPLLQALACPPTAAPTPLVLGGLAGQSLALSVTLVQTQPVQAVQPLQPVQPVQPNPA